MTEEIGAKLLPHATDTYDMIHGGMLEQNKGKQVSLVGKVEEAKGATFVLLCNGTADRSWMRRAQGESGQLHRQGASGPTHL